MDQVTCEIVWEMLSNNAAWCWYSHTHVWKMWLWEAALVVEILAFGFIYQKRQAKKGAGFEGLKVGKCRERDKRVIVLHRAVPRKERQKRKAPLVTRLAPLWVEGSAATHDRCLAYCFPAALSLPPSSAGIPRDTPLKCETLWTAATLPESMWSHKWVSMSRCVW